MKLLRISFHFLKKLCNCNCVIQIPKYFKSITDISVIMITKLKEVQVQMIWKELSNVNLMVHGEIHQFVSVSANFIIAPSFLLPKLIGKTFKYSTFKNPTTFYKNTCSKLLQVQNFFVFKSDTFGKYKSFVPVDVQKS